MTASSVGLLRVFDVRSWSVLLGALVCIAGCGEPNLPTGTDVQAAIAGATSVQVEFQNMRGPGRVPVPALTLSEPEQLQELESLLEFTGPWGDLQERRVSLLGAWITVYNEDKVVLRFFVSSLNAYLFPATDQWRKRPMTGALFQHLLHLGMSQFATEADAEEQAEPT